MRTPPAPERIRAEPAAPAAVLGPGPVPLTARQREVLEFITRHVERHEYPPTGREISDACRLGGPSGAQRMLTILEQKGYLQRTPGRSRAITLLRPPLQGSSLAAESRVLVAVMLECQAYERDTVLAMAAACRDHETKAMLIQDASERHAALVRVEAAVRDTGEPDGSTAHEVRRALGALGQRPPWPAFVVDRLVLNGIGASVARAFGRATPELRVMLDDLAAMSERAARAARGWLGELIALEPNPSAHEALRRRAQLGNRVSSTIGRSIERRGGPALPSRPAATALMDAVLGSTAAER